MSKEHLTPEEELHAENQIKALDLEMLYDAKTFISDDAPPELINEWLDQVKEREEAFQNAPKIPVYDFIGQPTLRPVEDLKDDEAVEKAITNLLELLNEKFVLIDRPTHLSPKGYYHFLTTDFMQHRINNYSAFGLVHTFSYNQFRHDGPDFIAAHALEVIEDILDLSQPYQGVWLSETCRGEKEALTKVEVIERIHAFRATQKEIVPMAFEPDQLYPTEDAMYFMFKIAWGSVPADGSERIGHEGLGVCQMSFEDGEWLVQGVKMPGFEF